MLTRKLDPNEWVLHFQLVYNVKHLGHRVYMRIIRFIGIIYADCKVVLKLILQPQDKTFTYHCLRYNCADNSNQIDSGKFIVNL